MRNTPEQEPKKEPDYVKRGLTGMAVGMAGLAAWLTGVGAEHTPQIIEATRISAYGGAALVGVGAYLVIDSANKFEEQERKNQ